MIFCGIIQYYITLAEYYINLILGGSTLKTSKFHKFCLIGFDKSAEDNDHGNGGKHARTYEENGLEFISFSINTT